MPNADMVGYTFQVEVDYLIGVPSGMNYLSMGFPTSILWTVFDSSDSENIITVHVSSDSETISTEHLSNDSDIQSSADIQLPNFDGMLQSLVAYAFAQIEIARGVSTASISDSISMKNATMCSLGTCLRDYKFSVYNGQASIQTGNIDFGTNFIHTGSPDETNDGVSYTGPCWAPQNKSKIAFTSCLDMDMVPLSGHTFFPAESPAIFENSTTQWTHKNNFDNDDSPILNRIDRIGFEKMILNLAASFTKTGLEITNDTFDGTVHGSKVFVSVQWYWLILPTLLMISGTIFFTITVLANRRARIPL
ncbi:hypothetical protein N7488_004696 [Penicillium malachiteum]|nr:hypothetical protein N7488_004696 [Penicillium malachiteum]